MLKLGGEVWNGRTLLKSICKARSCKLSISGISGRRHGEQLLPIYASSVLVASSCQFGSVKAKGPTMDHFSLQALPIILDL